MFKFFWKSITQMWLLTLSAGLGYEIYNKCLTHTSQDMVWIGAMAIMIICNGIAFSCVSKIKTTKSWLKKPEIKNTEPESKTEQGKTTEK